MRPRHETSDQDQGFFGHPSGLGVLAGLEVWDRISFYGMQSLLVLYMVGQLLLPGHVENISGFAGFRVGLEQVFGPLSTQALASQIFGLYVGLVALTPLIGGFLGDRFLGRRTSIIIGARNEEQFRQNLGAVGWNLTPDQIAKLDAASERPLIYPYWHQRGFVERNPAPV